MLFISGHGSRIAEELRGLLPHTEPVSAFSMDRLPFTVGEGPRYLFAAGHLEGQRIDYMDEDQLAKTWEVNFAHPAAAIETILGRDRTARIVVIGSESALSGSFDAAYAGAKAALHRYVESKPLAPGQQLVCVAPGIIGDAGMTTRRADVQRLAEREAAHPKQRFITALEVARLIHFLLYIDEGYISGVTIRMNGGAHVQR